MRGVFAACDTTGASIVEHLLLGTQNLQHRGQHHWGLVTAGNGHIWNQDKGEDLITRLRGERLAETKAFVGCMGVGHVSSRDPQPFRCDEVSPGPIVLGMDGYFTNAEEVRRGFRRRGFGCGIGEDVELLATTIWQKKDIVRGIARAMKAFQGPLAFTLLTPQAIYASRGVDGGCPMIMASQNGIFGVGSESRFTAFDLAWQNLRDIKPGEVVRISPEGSETVLQLSGEHRYCIFEWIYYAHPNSVIDGVSVAKVRHLLGGWMAEDDNIDVDLVAPIPDSGNLHAEGYSMVSGLPYRLAYEPPKYRLRTYNLRIGDRKREKGLKLWPIVENIRGKRIVLVDDSIRSAITIRDLIKVLYALGAEEVHVRIASPASIRYCPYCPPAQDEEGFIASTKTVEEIREHIGATTLRYMPLERVCDAIVPNEEDLPRLAELRTTIPCEENLCVGCFLHEGCFMRDRI
jgi:amidophosphoribosyltransferase